MVVLAVALINKKGTILLSRNYVDMSRLRIEGILTAFPKLLESGTSEGMGRQHTYVETGTIRYVYQPIENLYLLLVTTRASNIVQDLDILRLLFKVVPEYTAVTEEEVLKNVFELIFAFDEVITLGYKENTTLETIRTNLEMESHNEKLHNMVQQSKMNEARQEATRKAAAIKATKLSKPMPGIGPNTSMPGIGPDSGAFGSSSSGFGSSSSSGGAGFSSGGADFSADSGSRYGKSTDSGAAAEKTGVKIGKGLQIGKKAAASKGNDTLQKLAKEDGIDANALVQQQSSKISAAAPGAVQRSDPTEVRISESVNCVYDRDGAMREMEVKGVISVQCREDENKIRLHLEHYGDVTPFKFGPHPNLSRPQFSSNILEWKTLANWPGFPRDKPTQLLRWRFQVTEDEALVPLKLTCWPESNGDGTITVSLEVELLSKHLTLQNVVITVPVPSADEPEITSEAGGSYKFIAKKHQLEWSLPLLNSDSPSGNLEFVVSATNESGLFPVAIAFQSDDTICPIHVAQVTSVESNEPVKFGLYRQLVAEKYEVVN